MSLCAHLFCCYTCFPVESTNDMHIYSFSPESAMEHMNEIYMDAGDAISKVFPRPFLS